MIQTGEAAAFEERIRGNSAPRQVCAWCHTIIREGEDPATHGICPACQEKEMRPYLDKPAYYEKGTVG
jgi:hypothetical protein